MGGHRPLETTKAMSSISELKDLLSFAFDGVEGLTSHGLPVFWLIWTLRVP